MTMKRVTPTTITGLSVSGTADGSGTWNEDLDLDSFVTVPAGANGVLMHVRNGQGSAGWVGCRTAGKTTPVLLADMNTQAEAHVPIPLGPGNTIDLYQEFSSAVFTPIGFFIGPAWVWLDVDGPAIELPSSGGVLATVTAPNDVPANATIMMLTNGSTDGTGWDNTWRPTGQTTVSDPINGPGGLLKLNGARQVDINTSSAKRILGYCTQGIMWRAWYPTAESGAGDGTFQDAGTTSPTDEFAYCTCNVATTVGVALRENGGSFPSAVPAGNGWASNRQAENWYAPLASGVFEFAVEAGTVMPRVLAFIAAPAAAAGSRRHSRMRFGGPRGMRIT